MDRLQIRRLGYALGAQVSGIDLRKPLDDDTAAALRQAWLEHLLLCFPNQPLNSDELLEFAKHFVRLEETSVRSLLVKKDRPELKGYNVLQPSLKEGHNWHTDRSYTTQPSSGAFLVCKETPAVGGDTMFANMYMAYDTLSATMQRIVQGLSLRHVRQLTVRGVYQTPHEANEWARKQIVHDEEVAAKDGPTTVHPAVRVHPETKRKALYLGVRAVRFVGMTDDESDALLGFLSEHAVRHEFTYRHRWSRDDLVMWDNRCLLHIALSDYDLQRDRRDLLRCAGAGETSGHPYTPVDDLR